MPRVTKQTIEAAWRIETGAERVWDDVVKGLFVELNANHGSWYLDYRLPGLIPETGKRWSGGTLPLGRLSPELHLAEARKLAREAKVKVARGIDPAAERKAEVVANLIEIAAATRTVVCWSTPTPTRARRAGALLPPSVQGRPAGNHQRPRFGPDPQSDPAAARRLPARLCGPRRGRGPSRHAGRAVADVARQHVPVRGRARLDRREPGAAFAAPGEVRTPGLGRSRRRRSMRHGVPVTAPAWCRRRAAPVAQAFACDRSAHRCGCAGAGSRPRS